MAIKPEYLDEDGFIRIDPFNQTKCYCHIDDERENWCFNCWTGGPRMHGT